MNIIYYENPQLSNRPNHLAAELARHLLARQYLGTAIIVADNPLGLLSQTRRFWLKMCRALQRERASTVNAEKILRLTYAITHMQHLRFVAKSPREQDADVYFVRPDQAEHIPPHCYTMYLAAPITRETTLRATTHLQHSGLVVDYVQLFAGDQLGLRHKQELIDHVELLTKQLESLLKFQNIDVAQLLANTMGLDEALEQLQGISHTFLQQAQHFQHYVELARPNQAALHDRQVQETIIELAYRLQVTSPSASLRYSKNNYMREDTTQFLRDSVFDEFADVLQQATSIACDTSLEATAVAALE